MSLPTQQEAFLVITLLYSLLVLVALIKPQTFKFLLDKGTEFPSLQRQGQYVALVTMTWGFFYLVSSDKLTAEYAASYALIFTGSQALSIWLKMKAGNHDLEKPNGPPTT